MKKIFTYLFILSAGLVLAPLAGFSGMNHGDHSDKETASAKKKMYHCPMHPNYTSDRPGDCPICGMKLVPIEEEEHEAVLEEHSGHKPGRKAPSVPGQAPIQMSAEREQLIGVKTGTVAMRKLKKIIRASARVAYDTELYNAISEYKAALKAREKIERSPWAEVHERAESLVQASALKLRQMGLGEEQIENIEENYSNPTNLLLGEKGEEVWVYAQVYEFEAAYVRPGLKMEVTTPALQGRRFFGEVFAVDPILNSETRSLKVRGKVPNPYGLLKPEMFVNAKIEVDLGEKLAVPEEAVLNTGERQIVFVNVGTGKYEPRLVQIGMEAEGYYEVLSGVSQGERVVTSANFLIDSESKLKSAIGSPEHKH